VLTDAIEDHHLLIVDHEAPTREQSSRILESHGHRCLVAATLSEAQGHLTTAQISLMICDVDFGTDSGLSLVREARMSHPDVAVLMASSHDDPAHTKAAVEAGAYGYLVKPFGWAQLLIAVENALTHRRLEREKRIYQSELEWAVDERTSQLQAAVNELRESREQTVRALARAVEARNGETGAHIARIGATCKYLAERLGLDEERVRLIRTAAAMHDEGKIGIPDRILLKPGPLDPDERAEIERHPKIGAELLGGIGSELLNLAAVIALSHHEWFDGSGYPDGLSGELIPLEGRIVAVADVFDALTSDRVYRPAFSLEDALYMMRSERGTHFDPAVLDPLLENFEEIVAIAGTVATGSPASASEFAAR